MNFSIRATPDGEVWVRHCGWHQLPDEIKRKWPCVKGMNFSTYVCPDCMQKELEQAYMGWRIRSDIQERLAKN